LPTNPPDPSSSSKMEADSVALTTVGLSVSGACVVTTSGSLVVVATTGSSVVVTTTGSSVVVVVGACVVVGAEVVFFCFFLFFLFPFEDVAGADWAGFAAAGGLVATGLLFFLFFFLFPLFAAFIWDKAISWARTSADGKASIEE
jgi:hypothetical protein